MSLVNYRIPERFHPTEEENIALSRKIEAYNVAFKTQKELMLKELGVYIPLDTSGKYLVLVKCIIIPEKSKGGIFKAGETIEEAKKQYNTGLVVGIGIEAYRDPLRFPFGPSCKVGDWVSFSRFESQPEKFNGFDCRYILDDKVNVPIPDIEKAYPELF